MVVGGIAILAREFPAAQRRLDQSRESLKAALEKAEKEDIEENNNNNIDDHDDDGIPNEFDSDFVAGADGDSEGGLDSEVLVLIGLLVFLLAVISVAMIAKQAGRRKAAYSRAEEMKVAAMFQEEEARRLEWIDYYVAQGDIAKAMELGYQPPAQVPQWQQHQMQQQQIEQASVPTMMSLDDL